MFFAHPLAVASDGLMDWNFGNMITHGIHLTIGSDWAADDFSIFPPCAAILERVAAVMPGPDRNAATRQAAEAICNMLTIAGSEAIGRAHVAGSIAVGKKANFIAVDGDLSVGEFDGAQVLGTWFEGERVYEAGTSA